MSDLLTMAEIEAAYDGEWVVLDQIESGPGSEIVRARVVWHGKDHDEAWARSYDTDSRRIAVFYVGPIRADEEPVLML
jgi:hypothetical protein